MVTNSNWSYCSDHAITGLIAVIVQSKGLDYYVVN